MGSLEDIMTPSMDLALDLFGEQLQIQNFSYDGEHPEEGTPEWTEDTIITVQGRILQNQRPMESGDSSSQQISAEYHAFVPSDTELHDGLRSDEEKSSTIIDSDGYQYDVLRIVDEHNGLYRCQCSFETPQESA